MVGQLMRIGVSCLSCWPLSSPAGVLPPKNSGAQGTQRSTDAARPVAVAASRRTAITDAVAKVAPAVVTVQTEVVQRVAADPFDAFFGGRPSTRSSTGPGHRFFIISC